MYNNAYSDGRIFLGILGRCGLTWIQSTAILYKDHEHKRKVKVCETCYNALADKKIFWKSVNRKWYTTYHCNDCIKEKVASYLDEMQVWVSAWEGPDHKELAISILLSGEQKEDDEWIPRYDLKLIAKTYLKQIQLADEQEKAAKPVIETLGIKIMRLLRDKATIEWEELKHSFPDEVEEKLVDALTELMSEGHLYEPESNLFKLIA